MNIRTLEAFLVLSEELHFRNAAERLGMSQSLVSDHLKKLENHLGCILFDRTSRRVTLTKDGEKLRKIIQIPVLQIKKAMTDMRFSSQQEVVKLGFMGGGFYELHESFINKVKEKYPEISLEFVELHYDNQFTAILNGDVDMSLCRLPVSIPGLKAGKILMRDSRVVCINSNHRLAHQDSIDFEELSGEVMLQAPIDACGKSWVNFHFPLLTPNGNALHAGRTIKTVREGLSAVASGYGIFLMTKRASTYYSSPNIKYIDVNLESIESALVWAESNNNKKIDVINTLITEMFIL